MFYCSIDCQRSAWAVHKGSCSSFLRGPAGESVEKACSTGPVADLLGSLANSGVLATLNEACWNEGVGVLRYNADGSRSQIHRGSPEEIAYLRSRSSKDPQLAYNLGNRYQNGSGVERDLKKSFDCFLEAAEGGLTEGKYAVACLLSNGVGVAKDDISSKRWMLSAGEGGHAGAQGCLCKYFREGLVGFPKSATEALRWAKLAAAQGNRSGELIMGEIAMDDDDLEGAVPWLERAAAHDSPRAQMLLALAHIYGIGCRVDVARGFALLRKAKLNGANLDKSMEDVLAGFNREVAAGVPIATMQARFEQFKAISPLHPDRGRKKKHSK